MDTEKKTQGEDWSPSYLWKDKFVEMQNASEGAFGDGKPLTQLIEELTSGVVSVEDVTGKTVGPTDIIWGPTTSFKIGNRRHHVNCCRYPLPNLENPTTQRPTVFRSCGAEIILRERSADVRKSTHVQIRRLAYVCRSLILKSAYFERT